MNAAMLCGILQSMENNDRPIPMKLIRALLDARDGPTLRQVLRGAGIESTDARIHRLAALRRSTSLKVSAPPAKRT